MTYLPFLPKDAQSEFNREYISSGLDPASFVDFRRPKHLKG